MPGLILKADINEIARLEHLFTGLGETGFIPIHGLQTGQTGKKQRTSQDQQQSQRNRMAVINALKDTLCKTELLLLIGHQNISASPFVLTLMDWRPLRDSNSRPTE